MPGIRVRRASCAGLAGLTGLAHLAGLAGLAGLALTPIPAAAQAVEVPTFTVPVAVDKAVPDYPRSALLRGEEALVEVHFMVDTDGHAFDPVVVDSTGSEEFREAVSIVPASPPERRP